MDSGTKQLFVLGHLDSVPRYRIWIAPALPVQALSVLAAEAAELGVVVVVERLEDVVAALF